MGQAGGTWSVIDGHIVWDAVVRAEESDEIMTHFRCTQMILWPRLHENVR